MQQHSTRPLPDQQAVVTQQSHMRGTLPPYEQQHAQSSNTLMVPSDMGDGSFPPEPGVEYFGDFAFDGMDDILFGFNASESIFQDFM